MKNEVSKCTWLLYTAALHWNHVKKTSLHEEYGQKASQCTHGHVGIVLRQTKYMNLRFTIS